MVMSPPAYSMQSQTEKTLQDTENKHKNNKLYTKPIVYCVVSADFFLPKSEGLQEKQTST